MDFVNGFVLSLTTKTLYKRTVFERLYYISLRKSSVCSWDKNVLTLVKALKRLLALLHKLFMCFVKVSLWSTVIPESFYMFIFYYKCDAVIIY